MQSNTPQLNIRLQILPEVQNRKNSVVANEIGYEISKDFEDQGYRIESVYTGELGGEITFLIWLLPLAASAVQIAGQALINEAASEIANKSVEKIADVFKQTLQKMKKSKHKASPVTIEMKSPTDEIKVQGSLADALKTILPALEKLEEQAAQSNGSQKDAEPKVSQKITELMIIKITIKDSDS